MSILKGVAARLRAMASPRTTEKALDDDPFLAVGLIKERRVFEWTPGLGSWKTQLGL